MKQLIGRSNAEVLASYRPADWAIDVNDHGGLQAKCPHCRSTDIEHADFMVLRCSNCGHTGRIG